MVKPRSTALCSKAMKGLLRGSALALTMAALIPSAALATIILPQTIEEMARESVAVLRGRVVDKTAAWDAEHRRIYTTTTLEVRDSIHATRALPRQLKVRTLGGEVGETGMKVAGTPQFLIGEDVLVFLRPDPIVADAFQVIGMAQGKFQIREEAKGQVVAVPSLEGLAFARPGDDGVLRVDGDAAAGKALPYLDLRARILTALQTPAPVQSTMPAAPRAPAPAPAPRE